MVINSKQTKAYKLLNRNKIKKLLQYWDKNPEKWARSSELRKRFVDKYVNLIYRPDGLYYDTESKKSLSKKPESLYNHDSELYSDLSEMVDAGILDNKKEERKKGIPHSYYRPSQQFKLEPLKLWQEQTIMNTPTNHVLPIGNNTLYLLGLTNKDFSDDEIIKLSKKINEITAIYSSIEFDIFKKVGEKKANKIWERFIDKLDVSPIVKFIFWLILIRDYIGEIKLLSIIRKHHLSVIKKEFYDNWNKIIKKNKDEFIKESMTELKKINSIDDNIMKELNNGAIFERIEHFHKFYDLSINTFFKKKFTNIESKNKKINTQINKYTKKYECVFKEIVNLLLDANFYISVNHNFGISYYDFIYGYGLNRKKTKEILDAISYGYHKHPFSKKTEEILNNLISEFIKGKTKDEKKEPIETIEEQNNFFSKNDFLAVFEGEIIEKLACEKVELYEEMDKFADMFDMPDLPRKI